MRNCVVEHLGRRVDLRAIGSNPRPSRHRGFFRRCINHQRGCAARIAGSHDGSARARPVACRCCALRFSDDALVRICGPAGAVRCRNALHSVPSWPETRDGQSYVRFCAFWNFCFVSRRGARMSGDPEIELLASIRAMLRPKRRRRRAEHTNISPLGMCVASCAERGGAGTFS